VPHWNHSRFSGSSRIGQFSGLQALCGCGYYEVDFQPVWAPGFSSGGTQNQSQYIGKIFMANMPDSKIILALVGDLMFTVKITEAAKRNGMQVEYVKTDADLLEKARQRPRLVVMDLNIHTAEPVELIQKLKADAELQSISILGYVSHVQGDLKLKAQEAGANLVLARSAFTQNLPQLLRRHAGSR
jgi:PleD family two-component response regulator